MTTVVVKKVKTDIEALSEKTILLENGFTIAYETATEMTYIDSTLHAGSDDEFEGGYIIVGEK
ncbi:hypothetical protein ESZ36_17095 [Colwellia demingiae]|uniref:Uncharacterized protein n=1 Tax=Colwellia demingiae TaxID=89401 RepID=A0A5C6QA41_9GAMM|nr:hypothetical protein [Colwellia demingiae]TWX65522.1 hypothetical protein ESZ36_17095 [Colwellia demingiae]